MGTQKNRLNETVLLSTQNIYLIHWVRKYLQFYAENLGLSKPVRIAYFFCRFEDVVDVVLPSRTSIQISTKNKAYVFYTNRARQMKEMIDQYLHETDMVRNI